MPISQEQLAQIIQGKAKALCSAEGDKIVESYRKGADGGYDPDPSSYNDFDDSMYLSDGANNASMAINEEQTYMPDSFTNSRMPQAIKESMLKNQIDVSCMDPNNSVLDKLIPVQKKKVNERANRPSQPISQTQLTSPSVDYNALKFVVMECLKEYFQNQPLNEQATLSTIHLSEGKIKLVDNKGNLYASNLEYKGNVKDKKK